MFSQKHYFFIAQQPISA